MTLNVTVEAGSRRYVTDLEPTDFLVLEDGRKQELTFFQKTGIPLALALLLDSSASMEQSLPIAGQVPSLARDLATTLPRSNTLMLTVA